MISSHGVRRKSTSHDQTSVLNTEYQRHVTGVLASCSPGGFTRA